MVLLKVQLVINNILIYDTLRANNYLDNFSDSNGNRCNGYVIVNRVDNINHYAGYISCNEYTTRNYS